MTILRAQVTPTRRHAAPQKEMVLPPRFHGEGKNHHDFFRRPHKVGLNEQKIWAGTAEGVAEDFLTYEKYVYGAGRVESRIPSKEANEAAANL